MQIRVKLFVLNENAAKHLHLDPCQSPSRHMGSTPRKIYSVKISDPNKRDAKINLTIGKVLYLAV